MWIQVPVDMLTKEAPKPETKAQGTFTPLGAGNLWEADGQRICFGTVYPSTTETYTLVLPNDCLHMKLEQQEQQLCQSA